jgi:hypothetical protein
VSRRRAIGGSPAASIFAGGISRHHYAPRVACATCKAEIEAACSCDPFVRIEATEAHRKQEESKS